MGRNLQHRQSTQVNYFWHMGIKLYTLKNLNGAQMFPVTLFTAVKLSLSNRQTQLHTFVANID